MKVLLIYASKKELAPSGQERARNEHSLELPSHLPENTSAGVGTLRAIGLVQLAFIAVRLPRFQRAGPSTSLDKSAYRGYEIVGRIIPRLKVVVKSTSV